MPGWHNPPWARCPPRASAQESVGADSYARWRCAGLPVRQTPWRCRRSARPQQAVPPLRATRPWPRAPRAQAARVPNCGLQLPHRRWSEGQGPQRRLSDVFVSQQVTKAQQNKSRKPPLKSLPLALEQIIQPPTFFDKKKKKGKKEGVRVGKRRARRRRKEWKTVFTCH